MNTIARFRWLLATTLFLAVAAWGCQGESTKPNPDDSAKPVDPKTRPGKTFTPGDYTDDPSEWADAKISLLGRKVWLQTKGDRRRVLVDATVCLREGEYGLECLLCRAFTKEHESILRSEADAQVIHAALEAARARPGSPAQLHPAFKSPSGSRIRITLQYHEPGEPVTVPFPCTVIGGMFTTQYEKPGKRYSVPAQKWIRNVKTKKDLEHDWVFGGSRFYSDPFNDNKQVYAAELEGAFISVSNVPTAMLDLPVASPKSLEDRVYVPHTERIPPLDTRVMVILEVIPEAKK